MENNAKAPLRRRFADWARRWCFWNELAHCLSPMALFHPQPTYAAPLAFVACPERCSIPRHLAAGVNLLGVASAKVVAKPYTRRVIE